MEKEIMVSVLCLCYNHEKYIRNCLDGFVMQKTNFPFEVLIHDDASTDSTAEIIRDYENKYPDIIKPIYQTENQYSKGVKINATYQLPRVNGKYIALCEGDDFWTDENKLQLQYDALESHPECDASFHIVDAIDAQTGEHKWYHPNFHMVNILSREKFIDLLTTGGYHFQTSSYFLRTSTYLEYKAENPAFSSAVPGAGDTALLLWFASRSGAVFVDKVMSVYRLASDNSWTVLQNTKPLHKAKHGMYQTKLWQLFNDFTNKKYSGRIDEVIKRETAYTYLSYKKRAMSGKSEELDNFIKDISIGDRFKIRFSKYVFINFKSKLFPFIEKRAAMILNFYRKIKKVKHK